MESESPLGVWWAALCGSSSCAQPHVQPFVRGVGVRGPSGREGPEWAYESRRCVLRRRARKRRGILLTSPPPLFSWTIAAVWSPDRMRRVFGVRIKE